MKKALQALLLILAPLLATELGFRLYAHQFENCSSHLKDAELKNLNQTFVHHPHPGIQFHFCRGLKARLLGSEITSNSEGFRGADWSIKKDRPLIVGLGDSVLMGWGVADQKDFLHQAVNGINSKNKLDLQVMNLSMAGYAANHLYHLFREKIVKLKPTLVVMTYVGNDWESENAKNRQKRFSSISYALNYFVLNFQKITGEIPSTEHLEWRTHQWPESMPEDLIEVYNAISEMAEEHNIPIILVMDSRYESPLARHEAIEGLAKDLSFKVLNLFKEMRTLDFVPPTVAVTIPDDHNQNYLIPDDGHPNLAWHEEVARRLTPIILEVLNP